jgi:site-specific recombinase XerC
MTNHLVELGNSTKTINDGKLAALKVIFRWGIDNEVLPANPATGVSVERSRKSGEKMVSFEKRRRQQLFCERRRIQLSGRNLPLCVR